ncbi:DEAD/DEAH box helicase [Candidatus Bathyarchaeota archaeon]|nr:MAG: DEAD/DEAH box helicase [Candidatus Bathyarchaeota archaeon]
MHAVGGGATPSELDEVLSKIGHWLASTPGRAKLVYVRKEVVEEPELGPEVGQVGLHEVLVERLRARGIERLYKFQHEAYKAISAGRDVFLVSGAATGKTEAFVIPLLDRALKEGARSAVIYPTKALARDQLARFLSYTVPFLLRMDVLDGDTPEKERARIYANPPHLLITNPDMIHFSLPRSGKFRRLLSGVGALVLDEAHVYEGSFGSHVRMIMERLKAFLGPDIQFVASSATIGNPDELGELLFDRPVQVIEGRPRRRGIAYHALVSSGLLSRWTVAARLIYVASRLGLRCLTFVDSQQMCEVVARIAKREGAHVMVHRAGLLREERREVEDKLRSGELDGVVATPTLELGIDIGSLDAVIMAAPPPSYARYLQRAGRAGRRDRPGYIFTVLADDPIDAYYERRPERFFEQELTPVVFEPYNEEVAKIHLVALAMERGGRLKLDALPKGWEGALELCLKEGYAVLKAGWLLLTKRAYREFRAYSLRSAGREVRIIEAATGARVGTRSLPMALHDLHPGAIYLHQGRTYEVKRLDLERYVAYVKRMPDDLPFYTRPLYNVEVSGLALSANRRAHGVEVAYGSGTITKTVWAYVIRHLYGGEEGLAEPAPLVPLDEPVSWSFRTKLLVARYGEAAQPEAIHALEHAIIHAARPVVGAGLNDLGGVSYPTGHIVIYDATPGGSGLAKLLFKRLEKAHEIARDILANCDCEDGCPRCIYDPFCGNNNRVLSRKGALKLIEAVLRGEVRAPIGLDVMGEAGLP